MYLFNDSLHLFPFISDVSSVKMSSATLKKVNLCVSHETVRLHDPTSVTHKYFGNILVVIPWCLITYCMVFECCHTVLQTETCKGYKKQQF